MNIKFVIFCSLMNKFCFRFVVCNLYPFAQTVRRSGVTAEECIENIDIGRLNFEIFVNYANFLLIFLNYANFLLIFCLNYANFSLFRRGRHVIASRR